MLKNKVQVLKRIVEKFRRIGAGRRVGLDVPDKVREWREEPRAGWVSPKYSYSRSVHLDPRVLSNNRCVALFPDSHDLEPYKILRTQILQNTKAEQGNTVMITSSLPGEGKTLTSINLAFTFAQEFSQTAFLVDCDLRQQSVHRMLGIPSDLGVVDYLLNDRPLTDLIMWPGIEKITFISGGRRLQQSAELLGSDRMKALVQEMKTRYADRYIFFDAPPVLTGADTLAFAPSVDSILLVVQAGKTSLTDVRKAISLLPPEKLLGLVLNDVDAKSRSEYYAYHYYYPR